VKGLYVKKLHRMLGITSLTCPSAFDTDGDGVVDTEYIFYRNDTVGGGAMDAPVFSTTTTVYRYYLGTMAPNGSYVWSGSLPSGQQGSVLYIAFAAVDASGNADGTADDFWVFWDDLSFSYYACDPLPSGWSSSGDERDIQGPRPGRGLLRGELHGQYPYGFYFLDGSLNPVFGVGVVSVGDLQGGLRGLSYTFTVSNVCTGWISDPCRGYTRRSSATARAASWRGTRAARPVASATSASRTCSRSP